MFDIFPDTSFKNTKIPFPFSRKKRKDLQAVENKFRCAGDALEGDWADFRKNWLENFIFRAKSSGKNS